MNMIQNLKNKFTKQNKEVRYRLDPTKIKVTLSDAQYKKYVEKGLTREELIQEKIRLSNKLNTLIIELKESFKNLENEMGKMKSIFSNENKER